MSQKELERFVSDVKGNGHLQVQLLRAAENPAEVAEFANKHG